MSNLFFKQVKSVRAMEYATPTVNFIMRLLFRSLLFLGIYQALSYQIRVWKENQYFRVSTLFKIELLFHVIIKLWVLEFVSVCDDDNKNKNNNLNRNAYSGYLSPTPPFHTPPVYKP